MISQRIDALFRMRTYPIHRDGYADEIIDWLITRGYAEPASVDKYGVNADTYRLSLSDKGERLSDRLVGCGLFKELFRGSYYIG